MNSSASKSDLVISEVNSTITESNIKLIFEERYAAWKVFLPRTMKEPILAIGVSKSILFNLARSWPEVHAFKVSHRDIEWVLEQTEKYALNSRVIELKLEDAINASYSSIAINADSQKTISCELLYKLLMPGGAVAWIGRSYNLPNSYYVSKAGYVHCSRYAILPPQGFRIIVPLCDGRLTYAGLSLFLPGNVVNRFAAFLGRLISIARFQKILGFSQVVVARKKGILNNGSYLLEYISKQLNFEVWDAAIYPGTNENAGVRKLTLQLLDSCGHVVGIAKVADIEGARKAIARETLALKRLEHFSGLRNAIPRIISNYEWFGHAVQVQTAIGSGRKKYNKSIMKEHLDFLGRLSQIDKMEMPLYNWHHWPKVWNWVNNKKLTSLNNINTLFSLVEKCANKLKDQKIPFCRIHGDFTRWNVLFGKNGLSVVDWEQSDPIGLPCYDLVYYLISIPNLDRSKKEWANFYLSNSMNLLIKNTDLLNNFIKYHSSPTLRAFNYESVEALTCLCVCIIIMELQSHKVLADFEGNKRPD